MKRTGRVQMYKSKNGWRWRIIAANGRKLANCGQGYSRKTDCRRDLILVICGSAAWDFEGA